MCRYQKIKNAEEQALFFVTEKSKCFRGGTIAENNRSLILPQAFIFKQKQVSVAHGLFFINC